MTPPYKDFLTVLTEVGQLQDYKRDLFVRSQKTITTVADAIQFDPTVSIRNLSVQICIKRWSQWTIFHRDLNLFSYKILITSKLYAGNLPVTLDFFPEKHSNGG